MKKQYTITFGIYNTPTKHLFRTKREAIRKKKSLVKKFNDINFKIKKVA
jgi:hypothetical protein